MDQRDSVIFDKIIKGCYKNQRTSQNSLYRLYYSYGMSIATRYVYTEAESISIVNDTFLKVFTNIKSYDSKMDFKPWFRRILVNTALNYMKKEKKYKELLEIDKAAGIGISSTAIGNLTYKELLALLQTLSIAYKTVFNLYVIEGYSHKEIAGMLGITESTSKSNLARARKKLKELIQLEYTS